MAKKAEYGLLSLVRIEKLSSEMMLICLPWNLFREFLGQVGEEWFSHLTLSHGNCFEIESWFCILSSTRCWWMCDSSFCISTAALCSPLFSYRERALSSTYIGIDSHSSSDLLHWPQSNTCALWLILSCFVFCSPPFFLLAVHNLYILCFHNQRLSTSVF